MSERSVTNGGTEFEPGYLGAAIRRRLSLALIVAAGVMALVVLYLLMATPVYTANSTVVIDPRKRQVVGSGPVISGIEPDANIVETEMHIMQSRLLAQQVSKTLKLASRPEFTASAEGGGIKGFFKGLFYDSGEVSGAEGIERGIEDKLLEALEVKRVGNSYEIRLSYSSTNPKLASEVANAFASSYIADQIGVKEDAERQVNETLRERVNQIRGELEQAESAVARYRVEHGLLNAVDPALTEQRIAALDASLAQARGELAQERGQASALSAEAAVAQSSAIQSLRQQLIVAQANVAQLNERYGSRHPELIAAQENTDRLRQLIEQETRTVVRAYRANSEMGVTGARQRVAESSRALGTARSSLASNNLANTQLAELERTAASLRALYASYLDRFNQTSASTGLQTPDARIVSLAVPPRVPSSPRYTITLVIGAFLAMVCGFAAGVFAELAMLWRARQRHGIQPTPAEA